MGYFLRQNSCFVYVEWLIEIYYFLNEFKTIFPLCKLLLPFEKRPWSDDTHLTGWSSRKKDKFSGKLGTHVHSFSIKVQFWTPYLLRVVYKMSNMISNLHTSFDRCSILHMSRLFCQKSWWIKGHFVQKYFDKLEYSEYDK